MLINIPYSKLCGLKYILTVPKKLYNVYYIQVITYICT